MHVNHSIKEKVVAGDSYNPAFETNTAHSLSFWSEFLSQKWISGC